MITQPGFQGFTQQDLQMLQHVFEASGGDVQILQVFHELSVDPMEVHLMKLCSSAFTRGASAQVKRLVSPLNLVNAKSQPKKASTAS